MNRVNKLRITNYELRIAKIFFLLYFLCVAGSLGLAQSTNQSFPTPITANEISGKISARDIGDARLTSYFYNFNATQGDLFINVVTSNFNGDIDVFTADNLRPLTKITVYADVSASETGRVIYLRQPTKLILRVEGRTPNDDAANFRIKFAGSFAPAEALTAANSESELPTIKSDNQTDVRVNSVGTIIEIKPKPTPSPKETVARNRNNRRNQSKKRTEKTTEIGEVKPDAKEAENQTVVTEEKKEPVAEQEKPVEIQEEVKQNVAANDEPPKKIEETENAAKENAPVKTSEKTTAPTTRRAASRRRTAVKKTPTGGSAKIIKSPPVAALENIRLVISLKDGTKIERPMSEVLRFGIDNGILTVILKDGTISRYSLLDVEKTTIE